MHALKLLIPTTTAGLQDKPTAFDQSLARNPEDPRKIAPNHRTGKNIVAFG